MRMARVNITVPDDVLTRARDHGLNVSGLATAALRNELERLDKVAGFERMMAEIDAEMGPRDPQEIEDARRWAEDVYGSEEPERRIA